MSTSAVSASGTTGTSGPSGAAAVTGKPLDRDAFLKLLVTQLRNQDPMKPMEDKEFIAQLAQFSSLEQMQSLNTSMGVFTKSQSGLTSLNLIGRTVEWNDLESGEKMSGKVKSIDFQDGVPVLRVPVKAKDSDEYTDIELPIGYVSAVS
jgi:flagellar basal-body rod modification protein FlgD